MMIAKIAIPHHTELGSSNTPLYSMGTSLLIPSWIARAHHGSGSTHPVRDIFSRSRRKTHAAGASITAAADNAE
jgi:hypothetical protein